MSTSIINRIAIHATASTSLPTLPASSGSNVAKASWTSAGFSTIGGANLRSDNYNIGEDAFSLFNIEPREAEVTPPLGHGTDDMILLGSNLEDAEFKLYDIAEGLFTLGSNISVTSNVATLADSYTMRTVAIEIYNTAMLYIPKARVLFKGIESGMVEGQVAQATMMIKPLNVSGKPGGFSLEWY